MEGKKEGAGPLKLARVGEVGEERQFFPVSHSKTRMVCLSILGRYAGRLLCLKKINGLRIECVMGCTHLTACLSFFLRLQYGSSSFQCFSSVVILYCRVQIQSRNIMNLPQVNFRFLSLRLLKRHQNVPFVYLNADVVRV